MKKMTSVVKISPVIALVLSCAALSFAAGEKERMIERAPQIRTLKTSGVIGERGNGLLGLVSENSAAKAVVDSENADRKTVYAEISSSSGAAVTTVASRRAQQIFDQSSSGDWLQGADGKWYQKK